jgi:hypothetical protein
VLHLNPHGNGPHRSWDLQEFTQRGEGAPHRLRRHIDVPGRKGIHSEAADGAVFRPRAERVINMACTLLEQETPDLQMHAGVFRTHDRGTLVIAPYRWHGDAGGQASLVVAESFLRSAGMRHAPIRIGA